MTHIDLSQPPQLPAGHEAEWTRGALACPCGHTFHAGDVGDVLAMWIEHLPARPPGTPIAFPRPPRPRTWWARLVGAGR